MQQKIYVMRSPTHGRGVFSRRRITKGEYIGTFRGKPTTRNGSYTLWVTEDDGKMRGISGRNTLRFLNHSAKSNAEFWGADLYATRLIRADDEIYIDYGEDWADD